MNSLLSSCFLSSVEQQFKCNSYSSTITFVLKAFIKNNISILTYSKKLSLNLSEKLPD